MPEYTYRDTETGNVLTVEGSRPPNDEELEKLFAQYAPTRAKPTAPAAAPAPAKNSSGPERGIGTTLREFATEAGAATAGQAIGSLAGPAGTVVGGAIGGGAGNIINQLKRMSEDPDYSFRWGEFLADVGTGAIPGGSVAKSGAKAVAKEAVKQGVGGLAATTVQKVVDEGKLPTAKEAVLSTAIPAAGGAAAQKFLSKAPSSVAAAQEAFANRPQKLKTLEAGAARGLKIVPSEANISDANPSFVTTQLESLGGKAAVHQRIQLANADAVDNLAKASIGVAKDVELSPKITKAIRETESKVYEQVDALAQKAKDELDKIDKLRQQTLSISDPAQRAVEESNFARKYGAQEAALREQAAASLEDLRKVRGETQSMWDAYFNSAGKNVDAQQKAIELGEQADNLSKQIDTTLRKNGHAGLADRIDKARTRIARTYNIDEMMNPGTYRIDPDVALRLNKRGVPLGDELKLLAEFKAAFPNSLRDSAKVTSPDVSALGMAGQGLLAGTVGLTTGNLPLTVAAAFAKPVASRASREYLLSPGVQKRALEAGMPMAKPDALVGAAETAIRETAQQAGQQESALPVPNATAIDMLRKNPKLAKEFDRKYGAGTSRKYLKNR